MNRGNALERRLAKWRSVADTETPGARKIRVEQIRLVTDLKADLLSRFELADEAMQVELKGPLAAIAKTEEKTFLKRFYAIRDPPRITRHPNRTSRRRRKVVIPAVCRDEL